MQKMKRKVSLEILMPAWDISLMSRLPQGGFLSISSPPPVNKSYFSVCVFSVCLIISLVIVVPAVENWTH